MLVTIAVILLICWALGLLVFNVGAMIHILLVIAIVVVLIRIIQGRRPCLTDSRDRRASGVAGERRTDIAQSIRAPAALRHRRRPIRGASPRRSRRSSARSRSCRCRTLRAVIEGIIDVRGRHRAGLRSAAALRPAIAAVVPARRSIHSRARNESPRGAARGSRARPGRRRRRRRSIPIRSQVSSAHDVRSVALLPDGMALIHDVAAFLSAAEAETLDAALEASAGADRSR